ncbi:MAG: ribosome silencing factor [Chloroflexota bacterium]|nr:ribosome silencing factor [Chloroflexota bacterium]
MEAEQIARKVVEVASDKQASDIVLLDVRETCSFADYFVVCTVETQRQMSALADDIEKALNEDGVKEIHREGKIDSGWLLMDYGDVIINIFDTAERDYYKLDRLWSEAVPLVRIQ